MSASHKPDAHSIRDLKHGLAMSASDWLALRPDAAEADVQRLAETLGWKRYVTRETGGALLVAPERKENGNRRSSKAT